MRHLKAKCNLIHSNFSLNSKPSKLLQPPQPLFIWLNLNLSNLKAHPVNIPFNQKNPDKVIRKVYFVLKYEIDKKLQININ